MTGLVPALPLAGIAVAGPMPGSAGLMSSGGRLAAGTVAVLVADCRIVPFPGRRASPGGTAAGVGSGGTFSGAAPGGTSREGAAGRPEAPDPEGRGAFLFFACGIVHLPPAGPSAERSILAAVVNHRLARRLSGVSPLVKNTYSGPGNRVIS